MSRCNADRTFRVSQIVGLLIKADLFFFAEINLHRGCLGKFVFATSCEKNKKELFWLERMSQHILHFNPGKGGKESGERE